MAARYDYREVRIFGLYRDAVNGEHFAIVKSGRWAEIIPYLNARVKMVGHGGALFIENADGKKVPLMA